MKQWSLKYLLNFFSLKYKVTESGGESNKESSIFWVPSEKATKISFQCALNSCIVHGIMKWRVDVRVFNKRVKLAKIISYLSFTVLSES